MQNQENLQKLEEKLIGEQMALIYQICPQKLTSPVIEGYDFNKGIDYEQLLLSYSSSGIQASQFHKGIEQINQMIRWRLSDDVINQENDFPDFIDQNTRQNTRCTIFLGYTSNMMSSGNREIIRYLVQHKMIDCIVTSAGGVEEDLMKCMGPFHVGSWNVDDKQCRLQAINRIGNIFVASESYGKLEDWLMPIFKDMYEQQSNGIIWSPSSMIRLFGERINDERSVYYWAYKNNIPVFCPALTDGAIGDMMFYYNYKQEGLICDIIRDVVKLNQLAMKAKRSGVIILGGGVVKHHILNANIWRNGADHAVYINTGVEYDASDSGATAQEGISWGKLKIDANYVKIWCEATLVFPILVAQTFAKNHSLAKRN